MNVMDEDFPASTDEIRHNPLKDRIQDYDESWDMLGRMAIRYNWEYRRKVCSRCPPETRERLRCYKVDNFRVIGEMRIHETHCSKLARARADKLRNRVRGVFAPDPFVK